MVLADDGEVSFTDGRHTFAWLRDHGPTAVAVQVPPDQAKDVKRRFGVSVRKVKTYVSDTSQV